MNNYLILHNPRCSKSRQTLQLLQEYDIQPEIILYLQQPPSIEFLTDLIINKLKVDARSVIRDNEGEYKQQNLHNPGLSQQELIQAIAATPKLLQRPIVIKGEQAMIGRPPENILKLIQDYEK